MRVEVDVDAVEVVEYGSVWYGSSVVEVEVEDSV